MKLSLKFYLFFLCYLFSIAQGFARLHQIEMLNSSNKNSMVFEPNFLQINVDDEVEFIPTDRGHNSRSIFVPEGFEKWRGKNDEKIRIKFSKKGIYIFECQNHAVMGMVGAIKVSEGGFEKVKVEEFLKNYQKKVALNKNRIDDLLRKIDEI